MKLPADLAGVLSPEKLLKWEYWPYYLAALVVLVLLAVLVVLFLRRRGMLGGSKFRVPKALVDAKPRPMSRSVLKRIWKRFLGQIPSPLRRSILVYHPFVVMGELGSGKSSLIDGYTDWKGQANKFYPSYTADQRLQIYLGSSALVQEIPASLLNNTGRDAREALIRLWKPVFRKREPVVVLALNSLTLKSDIPENLRSHAQMMRGKINALAKACERPVEVRIALTRMDQLEGFVEFAEFIQTSGLPSTIDLQGAAEPVNLADALQPYEDQLSRALITLSSEKYLKILSFFKESPDLLRPLAAFAKVLQQQDPLSPTPRISRLCFCYPEGGAAGFGNPFEYAITVEDVKTHDPLLKHRYAAAALLVAGLIYFMGGYAYERRLLSEIDAVLDEIDVLPPTKYTDKFHDLFLDFSLSMKTDPALSLLPNFFPKWDQQIRGRVVTDIRQFFLLPKLRLLGSGEDDREKLVYLAGLIYGTRDNELGRLVLGRVSDWADILGLPTQLILDYVQNNLSIEGLQIELPTNASTFHLTTGPKDEVPLNWVVFFSKVQRASKEPLITAAYLEELQKEAKAYLKVAERAARYELSSRIAGLLKKLTPIGSQVLYIQARDEILLQQPLREFLKYVSSGDVAYPNTTGMDLIDFMESIVVMSKLTDVTPETSFRFTFGQGDFEYKSADWFDLLKRSRVTLFMRDFVAKNRREGGLLFFGKNSQYPDVVMNPTNDGLLFFVGKGRVDGRYTRSAFEQRVKPILVKLPELLDQLPLGTEEKNRFVNFVLKQSEAYADRYVASYREYYSQFHIQASSVGELRFILKQIQMPTSPFQDFLSTMRDNTLLDVGDTSYLRQFAQKLKAFESIKRLMAEKDGSFPELDKYKAVLSQMLDEVEDNKPFLAMNKADEANELKSVLSPLGRISLDIFRGDDNSYLTMVSAWLKSLGVEAEWQPPFVEPVQLAFFLGRNDVESSVDKIWGDLRETYIVPLREQFPFDSKAEDEIRPEELEDVAHPQGKFWKSFRAYLSPLCQENAGSWSVRVSAWGFFKLPNNMLNQVNTLARLTASLWDAKGVPRPMQIAVKPASLPPRREQAPVVILSYLHCGSASVFAFNQQPAWQKLNVEWWKTLPAAVGLEAERLKDSARNYNEVSVQECNWSFFRLLQKGRRSNNNVYSWQLEVPGQKGVVLNIDFAMQSDPWAMFKVFN